MNLNKLGLIIDFEEFLVKLLASNISLLDISLEHVIEVSKLPIHHRDPFDRLLIAQTLVENSTIISRDTAFDLYGVARVW